MRSLYLVAYKCYPRQEGVKPSHPEQKETRRVIDGVEDIRRPSILRGRERGGREHDDGVTVYGNYDYSTVILTT